MLDQLESMEAAAEQRYDEKHKGEGRFECDCGKLFNPETEGGTFSPNPYAMPICGDCLEAAIDSK